MQNLYGQLAALYGASAVLLGAFGAHALKKYLNEYSMSIYEKAVFYQFIHTGALLIVAILLFKKANTLLMWSGNCFALGILLFSGSLYLLANKSNLGLEKMTSILGPLTPIGGLFLLSGWIILFLFFLKSN